MKKIFLFVATFFAFCIFGGIAVEAKDYTTYDYITIEDGATYYESSEEFGSGRYAFVGHPIRTPHSHVLHILTVILFWTIKVILSLPTIASPKKI